MADEKVIRVVARVNMGLVGCDRAYELEYYGEDEYQSAVDSGEIYAHIEEQVQQDLDYVYERVE